MKIDIKIPSMGESISQVTIGPLIKQSGDVVAMDDELLELETDKVNQVLYAPEAGTVSWLVATGDVVNIGQVIGFVDSDKKGAQKEPQKAAKTSSPKKEPSKEGMRVSKEDFISELQTPELSPPSVQVPFVTSSVSNPPSQRPQETSSERETRKKMSNIRKLISKKLVDVIQQTAMLTTFNEVDMAQIMALRESYKEAFTKKHNAKLGYMSFFVKAAVSALKAYPDVNAYISGDEIVYRNYYDIGIAVSTDRGLLVPVVRDCDSLSFAGIEQQIESFAKKAREGSISPNDLQGGGFTITNGGTYGSLLSTPILNPPQSAILGMHKIMKRPVVINDEIVIRPMMYLALSYDHRIIDGKEAVSFLVHIKNCLEDPARLFLEV